MQAEPLHRELSCFTADLAFHVKHPYRAGGSMPRRDGAGRGHSPFVSLALSDYLSTLQTLPRLRVSVLCGSS
jgi:hypothetical protein